MMQPVKALHENRTAAGAVTEAVIPQWSVHHAGHCT